MRTATKYASDWRELPRVLQKRIIKAGMAARQDDIRVLREREAKIYNTQNGQLKQEWHLDRMIYEYYENEKPKSITLKTDN